MNIYYNDELESDSFRKEIHYVTSILYRINGQDQ